MAFSNNTTLDIVIYWLHHISFLRDWFGHDLFHSSGLFAICHGNWSNNEPNLSIIFNFQKEKILLDDWTILKSWHCLYLSDKGMNHNTMVELRMSLRTYLSSYSVSNHHTYLLYWKNMFEMIYIFNQKLYLNLHLNFLWFLPCDTLHEKWLQ